MPDLTESTPPAASPSRTLDPSTELRCAPNLQVKIASTAEIRAVVDGHQVDCGAHGLAILDAFSKPTSIAAALRSLQGRATGAEDWMGLAGTILHLVEAGVLQEATQQSPRLRPGTNAYEAASIHTAMLNDRRRTERFLAGIRAQVGPDDVVVDIGTGTGVLAIAAAQAGARHVYAIEASSIGSIARAMFEANGVADRITLIEGWSTRVTLPEPATVVVSEMIGHEPLGERVIELFRDARKRLMAPGGRFIPGSLRLLGVPLEIPAETLEREVFTTSGTERWTQRYGVEFSPLMNAALLGSQRFPLLPQHARAWKRLADPVLLAEIDFHTVEQLRIESRVEVRATTAGSLNGLMICFDLELGPSIRLATTPAEAGDDNHWYSPVWVPATPLPLRAGERFVVEYGYRTGGKSDQIRVSLP